MTGTDPAARSLADDLRTRPDAELAALLSARRDLLVPVPADIAQLAARATTRASTARALDRLDGFTLQVVDALMVAPSPIARVDVARALGVSEGAAEKALATLRIQAMAWGADDDLRLVYAVYETIGPHPAGLGPPMRDAFLSLRPLRLVTIMTGHGLVTSHDHASNADALASHLSDGDTLDALLDRLGPDVAAAVQALTPGPPTGRVQHALREVELERARTPIDKLLATGLLVPSDDATVVLPREIGLHRRGGHVHAEVLAAPPQPGTTARVPETVDRTAGAGAFDVTRKIEILLDTWSTTPPAVLRTGGLGQRDLRALPRLLDTDDIGAAFVAELAFSTGLVAPGGEVDDVWLPTVDYDTWCRDDVATRWARLAQAWLTTTRVAGLAGSRDARERPVAALGPGLDRSTAPETRRLVLDVLAGLPPGSAPDASDVIAAVRWRQPRRSSPLRDDIVSWTLREAEALGITGIGALATYVRPLLDRAVYNEWAATRDADDKATAAAADAIRDVLPEPLDHVLLQADLTAVAPGPLRSDLERELALLADVESRGGAAVYRFTTASLRRALDAGRSAADVHEFLASVSRTPVPQPLTYLVDDVARTHGSVRVGAASSFVRCDDQAVIAEILADPRSSSLGVRKLAPTVLASSLGPSTLLERLRQLGFTPVAEAADGSIVIREAPSRRARAHASRPHPDRSIAEETLLAAAIRALRAGDRSRAERPPDAVPGQLGRSGSTQTLAGLRRALENGSTVWIGYVDHHGVTTERLVDPAGLNGGRLSAFDHRSGEVRSFAVHRISAVAPIDVA